MVTRRPGESILIARHTMVTFVEHRTAGQVRLSVTAPYEVSVERFELAARVDPSLYDEWRPDGTRRYAGGRYGGPRSG